MPKFNISERELQMFSCEALEALAGGFRVAGRPDVANYIENIARAKGCGVQGSYVPSKLWV